MYTTDYCTVPTLYAQTNGIELAYDTFGDPTARPLLLIPGLGTQMISWEERFCDGLAARGFRVIRFDNRDVGLSTTFSRNDVLDVEKLWMQVKAGEDISAQVPYTLADMANDAMGLLDALGLRKAHIVGASMGGAIAQEMALRFPERVRTLVSIMASSGAPEFAPSSPEVLMLLMQRMPTDRAGYIESYQRMMKVLRAGAFPEEEARDPAHAARIFERGLNPAGFARQLAAILASGSRQNALQKMRVPTLVIHGDADPLVPIECGINVARNVGNAQMLTIKGLGHALPSWSWRSIVRAITKHALERTDHSGVNSARGVNLAPRYSSIPTHPFRAKALGQSDHDN